MSDDSNGSLPDQVVLKAKEKRKHKSSVDLGKVCLNFEDLRKQVFQRPTWIELKVDLNDRTEANTENGGRVLLKSFLRYSYENISVFEFCHQNRDDLRRIFRDDEFLIIRGLCQVYSEPFPDDVSFFFSPKSLLVETQTYISHFRNQFHGQISTQLYF